MLRSRWAAAAAVAVWLVCWLYFSRYQLLDDAFIHLHYADNLHRLHYLTYDGIHHSFGTSSLLYVTLLASLRGVITSYLLAKTVSVVFYLAALLLLGYLAWNKDSYEPRRICLYGVALALLSPSGLKWLTDGMETSMVACAVIAFAALVARALRTRAGGAETALFFIAGLALTFLRVELSLLAALSGTAIFLRRRQGSSLSSALAAPAALAAGCAGAMLTTVLIFGHLLPDTALAKLYPAHWAQLRLAVQSLITSFGFGIGITLVWLFSAAAVWRNAGTRSQRIEAALLNAPYPAIVALAVVRAQQIQSVRYVFWAVLFSAVINALLVAPEAQTTALAPRRRRTLAFLAVALLVLPLDWVLTARVMSGRAVTIRTMASQPLLTLFDGKKLMAADVGAFAYFSNAATCDVAGLVDGREWARLGTGERYQQCFAARPDVIYMNILQLNNVQREVSNLDGYRVCYAYDFNVSRSHDIHYVVVPAADAVRTCGALGTVPAPVPVHDQPFSTGTPPSN